MSDLVGMKDEIVEAFGKKLDEYLEESDRTVAKLSASEAVYGCLGWLTTMGTEIVFGAWA